MHTKISGCAASYTNRTMSAFRQDKLDCNRECQLQRAKRSFNPIDVKRPVVQQLDGLTSMDYTTWMSPYSQTHSSLRLFNSGFLEALTICEWWLPAALYGSCSLQLILLSPLPSLPVCLLASLLGWSIWWLLEYSIHRWLFHIDPNDAVWLRRLHFLMHGLHHKTPRDTRRLVMPILLSAPVAAALVLLAYCLIPSWDVWRLASAAGLLNYSCVYELCHYWMHVRPSDVKGRRTAWMKRLWGCSWLLRRHMHHHHKNDRCNFCISPNPLDHLLGTAA